MKPAGIVPDYLNRKSPAIRQHASGTEVIEFDLVLEYGHLHFMLPREKTRGR
jgi:hypothetical protein